MITKAFDKGMVFLCSDNFPKPGTQPMKHNYLIIGYTQGPLGMVQGMSITSMTNKDVQIEVPVKLCNEYVSYVVPYNLHSLNPADIELHNYKGTICDTERISKDDFIAMLRDLYLDHIGLGTRDHTAVMADYQLYCKNFWEEFKNVPEFRERKSASPITIANVSSSNDSSSDDEVASILGSIVRNTRENIESVERSNQQGNTSTSSYRNVKKSKGGKKARKQQKREQRQIERSIHDAIGQSTGNVSEEKNDHHLTLEMMKELENAPRLIKEWTDEQLDMFITGYERFGFTRIHTVVKRWSTQQSMMLARVTALNELEKRTDPATPVNNDPLQRPLNQWTETELTRFINLMSGRNFTTQEKIDYTGFKTAAQCYNFTSRVRKELESRTTASVTVV